MPEKEERMLDNIKPETWEELAIERLRSLRRELERMNDTLWPWIQDLGEFLEKYDEWNNEKKDREDS
jgi:hypothetical protein